MSGSRSERFAGPAYMIGCGLAGSVMSVLVKLAGKTLPSQEIVFARAIVTLVLSWAVLARHEIPVWGNRRGLLVVRGVLGFGGLSCFYYALTELPLAHVTVLHYLHPVLTALLAALVLGERAGWGLIAAIATSFAGVVLVTRPGFVFAGSVGLPVWPTAVAIIGAGFSAAAYVVVRKLSTTENPHVIVFYFPLIAVPASIPALAVEFVWPSLYECLLLLGVGVSTQILQVSLTKGLKLVPAGPATAFLYIQVLFASLWGVAFFQEALDALTVVGAGLILSGTILLLLRR